jgi:hypothetical protein
VKLQLLSDLHLESETFDPAPSPGADVLVLAGDLDSRWEALARFSGWPVPVLFVAGNHEFDGRDLDEAWPALRERCTGFGIRLLQRESVVLAGTGGRRVRFVGATRWCDFDVFGPSRRDAAVRAGEYYLRVMGARIGGRPLDATAMRAEGQACRAYLEQALHEDAAGRWDATVVVTHFAPSLRSGDPRYGLANGTASFCNADDDLLPLADLWLHGHVHCRHDYLVPRGTGRAPTRVVCQARGLAKKGEDLGFDPGVLLDA